MLKKKHQATWCFFEELRHDSYIGLWSQLAVEAQPRSSEAARGKGGSCRLGQKPKPWFSVRALRTVRMSIASKVSTHHLTSSFKII